MIECEASISNTPVEVMAAKGTDLFGAVLVVAGVTILAVPETAEARISLGTNSDAVADFNMTSGAGAHTHGNASNLVSSNAWVDNGALEQTGYS
jgi:hypothetical protein